MAKYLIPEYKFDGLQKKANQIQKKCQKFGCDFHFEVIGEHYKEIKDKKSKYTSDILPPPMQSIEAGASRSSTPTSTVSTS